MGVVTSAHSTLTNSTLRAAYDMYASQTDVDKAGADSFHQWESKGGSQMAHLPPWLVHCLAHPILGPITMFFIWLLLLTAAALRAENVPGAAIHVTGNTVIDALLAMRDRIAAQPGLAAGLDPLAARFAGRRIVAVTSHRRENFGDGMAQVAAAIARIADRPDVGVIFPVHPNPAVRPVMEAALGSHPNVALIDPLDYPHFVRLMAMSAVMLTDSGGVQEEAPSLGKPVLVMRDTTERPEGVAAGTSQLVGTDPDTIVNRMFALLDDDAAYAAMAQAHNPYGDGQAAQRIARIVDDAHRR